MDKTVIILVTKGCPDLGLRKGQPAEATFYDTIGGVPTGSVRVHVAGLRRTLYVAGSRRYLPPLNPGDSLNLHAGDPTRYVRITVQ